MAKQITVEQARQLGERIKAGDYDDDPQRKQLATHLVAQTAQRKNAPVIDRAQLTRGEQAATEEGKFDIGGAIGDVGRATLGAVEAGATIGSSAVSEVGAGLVGLGSFVTDFVGLTDYDADSRADLVNELTEAYTFKPRTEGGNSLLQSIAAPLMTVDNFARNISEIEGEGHELASTMIYTTLLSLPDILGIKGGRAIKGAGKLSIEANRLEALARDLGVNPKPSRLAETIIESAKDMVPEVRAANADGLGQALQQAQVLARTTAEDAAVRAASSRAIVDVKEAAKFADNYAREAVAKGIDINDMPTLQRHLESIANLETRSPSELSAAITKPEARTIAKTDKVTVSANIKSPGSIVGRRIQDIQMINNRISTALETKRNTRMSPGIVDETTQLIDLQRKLDGWLDNQFNSDMIKGDPRAVRRWREAVDSRKKYNERFNADKTLVQLMNRAAKPDELHRWIFGASAAGAKPQAVSVIKRLNEVLGKKHPAMKGVKQDFLYELAKPLMGETPDLKGFVRNFDKTMKDSSRLVAELGIKNEPLSQLRNFANHAVKLNLHKGPKFFDNLAQSMSQFLFGHELSRRSLFVKKATFPLKAIGRILFGPKHGQAKEFISNMAGANMRAPVIDKFGAAAGNLLIGAAAADIEGRARVFLQQDDELERKMKELQQQMK